MLVSNSSIVFWVGPLLTALVAISLLDPLRSKRSGGIEYPLGYSAMPSRKARYKAMKIFGKLALNFTADDGRQIVGTNIWYGVPLADPNGGKKSGTAEGYKVMKAFISPDVATYDDIPIEEELELTFNYKGKIVGIETSII